MIEIAQKIIDKLRGKELMLAVAESCTGGMVAACLTEIAGASSVLDRGFVTYSNQAKIDMLGVDKDIIDQHGAVSAQCATAMAAGALTHSTADIAISITGIAGPGGGSAQKPVGTVYIGYANKKTCPKGMADHHLFDGTRASIREQSLIAALSLIIRNGV